MYNENVPSCLSTKDLKMVGYIKRSYNSNSLSYWCTSKGGEFNQVHRLIWRVVNGEIPEGMVINHIDTNGLNNKISNLELCSAAHNNRRQGQHLGLTVRPDNKIGVTGVKIMTVDKHSYSVARIRVDGKLIEKSFSHLVYGEEKATELAIAERLKMLTEYETVGFRNNS